jgi:tRNA(Ile)-lysidine synthase
VRCTLCCPGKELPENGLLLTAHHADDQAETLLLQMLRGAGVADPAGMPACRAFGSGRHARPLLPYTRAELHDYARQHQLHWIEDPSNQDTGFDRNYLRQQIMPQLKARWPAAARTLARGAGHLAGVLEVLQGQPEQAMQTCPNAHGRLQVSRLSQLNTHQRARVVRAWVQQSGHALPQQAHLT